MPLGEDTQIHTNKRFLGKYLYKPATGQHAPGLKIHMLLCVCICTYVSVISFIQQGDDNMGSLDYCTMPITFVTYHWQVQSKRHNQVRISAIISMETRSHLHQIVCNLIPIDGEYLQLIQITCQEFL